jgi:hypothetical protein
MVSVKAGPRAMESLWEGVREVLKEKERRKNMRV